jgi:hypothetical protein
MGAPRKLGVGCSLKAGNQIAGFSGHRDLCLVFRCARSKSLGFPKGHYLPFGYEVFGPSQRSFEP